MKKITCLSILFLQILSSAFSKNTNYNNVPKVDSESKLTYLNSETFGNYSTPSGLSAQFSAGNTITATWNAMSAALNYDLANLKAGHPLIKATAVNTSNTTEPFKVSLDLVWDVYEPSNYRSYFSSHSQVFKLNGTTSNPNVIYVDGTNGNDNNDGSSWASAVQTIQEGIDLANLASPVKDVWVRGGTYTPATSNRFLAFNVQNVEIYGGFDGTEATLADRDLTTTPTILSGDLSGNDNNVIADGNSTYNDNSVTVVRVLNDATIDGFTIASGYASGSISNFNPEGWGAGLYIGSGQADLTIRNCIFERNVARGGGAGILTTNTNNFDRDLRIESCVFRDNLSRFGTGIYHSAGNAAMNIKVVSSLFYNNVATQTAQGNGGLASSIWLRNEANAAVTNAFVVNNTFVNNEELSDFLTLPISDRATVMLYNLGNMNLSFDNNAVFNNINLLTSFPSPLGQFTDNDTNAINFNIRNNLNSNGWGTLPTSGISNNINNAPSFVDFSANDFRLTSNSAGINQGNNAYVNNVPEGISFDLSGAARVQGTAVDTGAYEFDPSLSVTDYAVNQTIKVFPNPVSDILNIDMSNAEKYQVFDVQGRLVLEDSTSKLKVSNLEIGLHFLKIKMNDGSVQTQKIIKN